MEAMVDGSSGDGVFAAAVNANDGMVAVASTAAAQLTTTTTIAAATIGQRRLMMPLRHRPSISPPPPSTATAINKDQHYRGRHQLPLPSAMTTIVAVDNKQRPLAFVGERANGA